ncbi:MAG TPA: hypothetical protein VFP05_02330 [Thermomicrobiales bacterium]|nr:hypothetical protein [Thermomicrobiales bacterium]
MERDRESGIWDLSAPSSQVLLTGAETPNTWAIRLAFKELVLRQALVLGTVRQRRLLFFSREVNALSMGRMLDRAAERPLVGALEAFPNSALYLRGTSGVPIDVAATEVSRWYRAGGGYVQAEVMPELERRGYYQRVQVENGVQWRLAEQGERKLEELRRLLDSGRQQFSFWLREDPEQAAAYVRQMGPGLLLLGNPAPWLWGLLVALLAGEVLSGGSIPVSAGAPFGAPLEPPQKNEGTGEQGNATEGSGTGSPGDRPADENGTDPSAEGGTGGFDGPGEAIDAGTPSPGDTIDGGFDGDGDGDGGGDGE